MSTVTGMRRSNRWVQRALSMRDVETREVEGEADIKVLVDTLYFTNHGPTSNYRPVLHVRGRLVGLVPYDSPEIAYGVTEVTFDRNMDGGDSTVDAFYEFSDEQLVALVQQGFFNGGFEPPADLLNQVWQLPAHYKGIAIAPRNETEAPLVFLDVVDRDGLVIDSENSGLDLSDYFPDYLSEIRSRESENSLSADRSMERTSQVNDMFAGMDLSEYDEDGSEGHTNEAEGASISQALSGASVTTLPVMESPLFDALMRNAQNKAAQESESEVEAEETREEEPSDPITESTLDSTFKSVLGDFVAASIAENSPAVTEALSDDSIREDVEARLREKMPALDESNEKDKSAGDKTIHALDLDIEDEEPEF